MTKEEERERTPWKRRGEWQWKKAKRMYEKTITFKNKIAGTCICSRFQLSLGLEGEGCKGIKKR